MTDVISLARDLVALDSRSSLSNIGVADRIEAELAGFEVERLDFIDPAGVAKRALVAHRGPMRPGAAFSAHMDTVPGTGWTTDPWTPDVAAGSLIGLGACDMKGPLAASLVAAKAAPEGLPVTLLYTFDEETTKAGARLIATDSALVRKVVPKGIVVVEPSGMQCVRGHRVHVQFTATATGIQAHSSTGKGLNGNLALVRFLHAILPVHDRLRTDPTWQDEAYDPPFSDFNITIDNHGTAVNVTVARATARIKFRYSRKVDPMPIVTAVRAAAEEAGIALEEAWEGAPPELAPDHPLVAAAVASTGLPAKTAPYGTDASELQAIAPCIVLGPGDVGQAHKPGEGIPLAELEAAPAQLLALAERVAAL
ncbi:M20/M25/M40 family metallo-hydrolase [Elioraea sp.]|uniref:M20/M25/M40 family metallo-hydrolase n=1 Tax=Elioraea sp. TaxID=2185103 RepID=UPI0025BBAE42|nr:M20/M25/M40 family metallo-hydrolase [Elioraea sp.]